MMKSKVHPNSIKEIQKKPKSTKKINPDKTNPEKININQEIRTKRTN